MLQHLTIRNIAIANNIDIEWHPGMTSISGETGAGKSILLNGLALVLGERFDSSLVRHGEQRAEVTASFNIARLTDAKHWLTERDLDQSDECILRRTLSIEGRSRAYVNGQQISLTELKALGQYLIDIHGQHAHQSLLNAHTHLKLLDEYGDYSDLVQTVRLSWSEWQRQAKEYQQQLAKHSDQQAHQELLTYQCEELAALNLAEDEVAALEEEFNRFSQAETLMRAGYEAKEMLAAEDDRGALNPLKQALQTLRGLGDSHEALQNAITLLDGATIQAQEALVDLEHYLDDFEPDPERQALVSDRLNDIHSLARKYRIPSEKLPQHLAALQQELASLEAQDENLTNLTEEIAQLEAAYRQNAEQLSIARQENARTFSQAVMKKMQQLAMPGAQFSAVCRPLNSVSITGLDEVEFMISLNQGQPLRALTKVASGGELSRISLAIEVICAEKSAIPTLVFDEVDVGISGATAEVVGRMLRAVGERGQVICVTHLPQVAALGHHHCVVSKQQDQQQTQAQIQLIDDGERLNEIARMLGGQEITARTRAHAKEMLSLRP